MPHTAKAGRCGDAQAPAMKSVAKPEAGPRAESDPTPPAPKFPCPYCKGKYSWVEPVLDDGSGPTYSCGFCDEGMIEVGSEKHMEIKRNNPPKDIMWEMLAERDFALAQVIDALEKLPPDGWSEGRPLLEVCKKAKAYHYEPR